MYSSFSLTCIFASVLVSMLEIKQSKFFAAVLFVLHFNIQYVLSVGSLCDRRYLNDTIRIDGKVVIITGGTGGLGFETARNLAGRGGIVYISSRGEEKGNEAAESIRRSTGNYNVKSIKLDLGSINSIREFAKTFHSLENRLDILINNAGTASNYMRTEDGFEENIGVNHLGHFLLTHLLLDLLKASAPSRIIVVSSMGFRIGVIRRDNLNSDLFFPGILYAYCNSKLANILFTRELSKILKNSGVTVNSLDPGFAMSAISRNLATSIRVVVDQAAQIFGRKPEHAIESHIMLAVDSSVKTNSGKHFKDCIEQELPHFARDDATARWLWDASVELLKL